MKTGSRRAESGWWVLDALVVALFVAIGRSAHHHVLSWGGFASTLWPFGTGLLIGWTWVLARGRRGSSIASGVVVWLTTVTVGMLLRVEFSQGTALEFVAVTLGFLGALMLGARLLAGVLRARTSPPT
ncbi:MAG: DUF3054 domain-containing protein [Acidimicrobiales bacterium]